MIEVTPDIHIDASEIRFAFIKGTGPGGQNVNKVATTVQLRFDLQRNHSLPEPVRRRLIQMAGRSLNREGTLVITVRTHRRQDQNRQEAMARLLKMIRQASRKPKVHRPTRIPPASRLKRLENKRRRSQTKSRRQSARADED
jgi:ribosome-associated protein